MIAHRASTLILVSDSVAHMLTCVAGITLDCALALIPRCADLLTAPHGGSAFLSSAFTLAFTLLLGLARCGRLWVGSQGYLLPGRRTPTLWLCSSLLPHRSRGYKRGWCAASAADVRVPTCNAHVPNLVDDEPESEAFRFPEELRPCCPFFAVSVSLIQKMCSRS